MIKGSCWWLQHGCRLSFCCWTTCASASASADSVLDIRNVPSLHQNHGCSPSNGRQGARVLSTRHPKSPQVIPQKRWISPRHKPCKTEACFRSISKFTGKCEVERFASLFHSDTAFCICSQSSSSLQWCFRVWSACEGNPGRESRALHQENSSVGAVGGQPKKTCFIMFRAMSLSYLQIVDGRNAWNPSRYLTWSADFATTGARNPNSSSHWPWPSQPRPNLARNGCENRSMLKL